MGRSGMNLKPCPACNCTTPEIVYGNDTYVTCPTCHMRGPGHYANGSLDLSEYIDRDIAVKSWNNLPRHTIITEEI